MFCGTAGKKRAEECLGRAVKKNIKGEIWILEEQGKRLLGSRICSVSQDSPPTS